MTSLLLIFCINFVNPIDIFRNLCYHDKGEA